MENSKLQFDLQEIPEGSSDRSVDLPHNYFDLNDEVVLNRARVDINFYKTDHFIKTSFEVNAEVDLICDRCLEHFSYEVLSSYDVLYEPGEVDEMDSKETAVRQIPSKSLDIDIEDEVRDSILLEIPSKKIHPKFVDEDGNIESFETKKFGNTHDNEETIDPRWEELKKLKK